MKATNSSSGIKMTSDRNGRMNANTAKTALPAKILPKRRKASEMIRATSLMISMRPTKNSINPWNMPAKSNLRADRKNVLKLIYFPRCSRGIETQELAGDYHDKRHGEIQVQVARGRANPGDQLVRKIAKEQESKDRLVGYMGGPNGIVINRADSIHTWDNIQQVGNKYEDKEGRYQGEKLSPFFFTGCTFYQSQHILYQVFC